MTYDQDDLFRWGLDHLQDSIPSEETEGWGNELVHATDGEEAHEASEKIKPNIGGDRKECFERFSEMILSEEWYATYKVFRFEYLPSLGYTPARSSSVTRRISDIVVRKNNPYPEALWLLCKTGEKFNGSAILTFTERGRLVLADPGLMTGVWGQRKKRLDS